MQKCLYFEKIGIAFRLQIVHFVYKTCISLTNRAFQITNLRFNYKSRISFYKCDFLNYNSAIEKEISPATLRKDLNIATGTMTKMRRNEEVALSVLLRICEYLDCNIGDICDAVKK